MVFFVIAGNIRQRFVQRVQQNQIQMTTPQKVMQPSGMVQQQIRFQTPVRPTQRQQTPNTRAVRPRQGTPIVRARMQTTANIRTPVNLNQSHVTSTPISTPRQRLTLTRLSSPNQITQIQPIISVGQPKSVVSITSPPGRGTNIVRTQMPVYAKTSPQTGHAQIQNTVTSTTPNATSVSEDLEDSIQAARITKQPVNQTENFPNLQQNPAMPQQFNENNDSRIVTLTSGTQMSLAEYKQRQAQTATKQLTGIRPIGRNVVQNRQPRFAAPNTIRVQRPVMVSFIRFETEVFS